MDWVWNRRRWTTMLAVACLAMLAIVSPTRSASASGLSASAGIAFCFFSAPASPRAAFAHPERFDCTTPQTSLPAGDYWALSAPLPSRAAATPVAVRFASLWQRDATLYALYGDGRIASFRLDGRALSRGMQMGGIIERPLPVRGTPAVRLLWHIEGSANIRGIVAGVELATPADSARIGLILAALYAAFAGLCAALLVYNLALWAALHHRFQIAYCAMMAALLVYAFSASGLISWVLPGIANNDRLIVNYVMLAVIGATALLFARAFFEAKVFAGWLGHATIALAAVLVVAGIGFAVLAPWQMVWLQRVYSFAFLGVVAIVPVILWRGWCRRSNYLWVFALAWATPIVLASGRIANTLHLIAWSFWLDQSTLVAMAVEALLSSVGIAYRMRVIAAERDEARVKEIAARLLADTDPLTGMLNRRAFLAQAIGREDEQTLMLADIDHFKRVNDTIGHDGGDEVLRSIARALEEAVPPGGLVARIGGEEFAIVAPATLGLEANDVLERIRNARMPYDLSVTASIGTCSGPLRVEADWKAMYGNADRALFAAKTAGRDRARRAATLAVAA